MLYFFIASMVNILIYKGKKTGITGIIVALLILNIKLGIYYTNKIKYRVRGMIYYQRTIGERIGCAGIGLHSGEKARVSFIPAGPNTGIRFKRTDISEEDFFIEASYHNLATVNYATTLAKDGYYIQTVEHLLAAIAGLGIDNLIIEIDAGEVPIMDGSAAPFISLLQEAGIVEQPVSKKYLKVRKPIHVGSKDKFIKILPADDFQITYTIDFNHPLINKQETHYQLTEATIKKISWARTFGFLNEIKQLRQMGLIKGGSLDNAIVIGDYQILNGGLRFEDELVCHKIVDFIGDLYLLGRPIIGHVIAYKAGHGLHSLLARELEKYISKWEFVPLIEKSFSIRDIEYSCPSSDLLATAL